MWITRVLLHETDTEVEFLEKSFTHEPTEEDFAQMKQEWINIRKYALLHGVIAHDKSSQVNGFYINENLSWLSKADRVGLANSIAIEKAAGLETTTLYLNGIALTIPVDNAIQMLSALELYALACYRKTEEHKININNLDTIQDVENYDYTQGYPEKLQFNI